jgi:hypothetical protein
LLQREIEEQIQNRNIQAHKSMKQQ